MTASAPELARERLDVALLASSQALFLIAAITVMTLWLDEGYLHRLSWPLCLWR